MALSPIPVFYSSELSRFDFGKGHPFKGDRFEAYIRMLDAAGLLDQCELVPPHSCTDEELLGAHTPEYIAYIKYLEKTRGYVSVDTPVTPDVVRAQRLIVGSGLQAAKLVTSADQSIVHTFGGLHHAGKDYGEGFCVFNDVAVTARYLVDKIGIERVMVIDTDAHQGNGTMDIFYDDPRVLFLSLHQDPRTLYPGRGFVHQTGNGKGKGFTINLPMPPYSGNRQYELAMDAVVRPVALEYEPQVIIRNGGSDPYYADELTNLGLDLDGLNIVAEKVRRIVDNTGKHLIDMMLSGYGDMVVEGWLALFCGIHGSDVDYKALSKPEPVKHHRASDDDLDRYTADMLQALESELRPYWDCF